jgi:hypothetical protein
MEVIAKVEIGSDGTALVTGENTARDREVIVKALEQALEWLRSHDE